MSIDVVFLIDNFYWAEFTLEGKNYYEMTILLEIHYTMLLNVHF